MYSSPARPLTAPLQEEAFRKSASVFAVPRAWEREERRNDTQIRRTLISPDMSGKLNVMDAILPLASGFPIFIGPDRRTVDMVQKRKSKNRGLQFHEVRALRYIQASLGLFSITAVALEALRVRVRIPGG